MIAWALRRILSTIPALLIVSVVLFAALARTPAGPSLDEETRARRWLDLPALYNGDPQDRPGRVDAAVLQAAIGDERGVQALLFIGAAGLPELVPALERLPNTRRQKLARALAPLAFRMGLDDAADLDVPTRADSFWHRALDERATELRDATIRRALRRHLADRAEPLYSRQIREADTAALVPLLDALKDRMSVSDHEEVLTLALETVRRASGVSLRDEDELRGWWVHNRIRYVEFDSIERLVARLTETRLGRWTVSLTSGGLGASFQTGRPVSRELASHAAPTLLRASAGLVAAYALGLPLAIAAAARRRGGSDRATLIALIALYAMPALAIAAMLRYRIPTALSLPLSAIALGALVIASISRHARSALLEVARQDHVRAARALGIHGSRLWFRFIARPALPPIVALAALEVPVIFAGALVAEDVLGLPGLGRSFGDALRSLDVPYLMGFAIFAIIGQSLVLLLSDLLQIWLDPRTREALLDADTEWEDG